MAKRKYYVVLDTETCNTIEQPIPYDVGWVICDRYGNIYEERSFVVSEVFFGMQDVMKSAYYAKKIPQYYEDIKSGKRTVAGMWDIRRALIADMKNYNTKNVGAYNMGFDRRALNNLIRYVSKSWMRWFFPFNTRYFCIWNMACDVILNRNSFIKFAEANGYESEAGNIRTSAEVAYRYITNKLDFEEEHTGLEDVKIEIAILAECYRQHKKMDASINSACWRKVQRKRTEMELRAVFRKLPSTFTCTPNICSLRSNKLYFEKYNPPIDNPPLK